MRLATLFLNEAERLLQQIDHAHAVLHGVELELAVEGFRYAKVHRSELRHPVLFECWKRDDGRLGIGLYGLPSGW